MTRYVSGAALIFATTLVSCGYHVGGRADLVPKSIQTIAIPSFSTLTTRYKLVDMLPQQIGREFIARTRFHIVNNPNDADAILNGRINTVQEAPTVFDPATGKATSVAVIVTISVSFIERSTGRVLFSRASLGFRQNYEVAADPHQFFDESGPALDRVSRDVAHDVVSAIVENF